MTAVPQDSKQLSNRALKRLRNKKSKENARLKESSSQSHTDGSDLKIGIVGGGIAGFALALALQQKGIHSTVFEKDGAFEERAQGYGLTLQQAGRAMKILELEDIIILNGVASSSHFIFDEKGKLVLFWGNPSSESAEHWNPNRNCHIPRQTLRKALLDALDSSFVEVIWGFELQSVTQNLNEVIVKGISRDEEEYCFSFNALVACDGIRSSVRNMALDISSLNPLHFLQTFVMLGIFDNRQFPIFHERMIQISDGKARMFIMPFDQGRSMWQLSFGIGSETEATTLYKSGPQSLKNEALAQCHSFENSILRLIAETDVSLITGYPVYDRDPPTLPLKYKIGINRITFCGDAIHCMSPFKGQGANQALLDAVELAECLHKSLANELPLSLRSFESKMVARTTPKVLASRESIGLLHCKEFLDIQFQLTRRGFGQFDEFMSLMETLRNEGLAMNSSTDELNLACARYCAIHMNNK